MQNHEVATLGSWVICPCKQPGFIALVRQVCLAAALWLSLQWAKCKLLGPTSTEGSLELVTVFSLGPGLNGYSELALKLQPYNLLISLPEQTSGATPRSPSSASQISPSIIWRVCEISILRGFRNSWARP